jgi:hypothetical protein
LEDSGAGPYSILLNVSVSVLIIILQIQPEVHPIGMW